MMNLAKKLSMMDAACWKPSGEERERPSNQSSIPRATKVITPETRWRMDDIAVTGNRIVERSKLTGLCFFTVLPTQLFFILLPPDLSRIRAQRVFRLQPPPKKQHPVLNEAKKRWVAPGVRVFRRPGGSIGGSHSDYNSPTISLVTFRLNSDPTHEFHNSYIFNYLI